MKSKRLISKFLLISGLLAVSLSFSQISFAIDNNNIQDLNELNSFNKTFNQPFQNISQNGASYSKYLDESDVYYKKGMEFYEQNQYSKAINMLEKALKLTPERIKTRTNLAVIYINRGTYYFNKKSKYENAASDYRKAIYYLKYDGYKPTSNIANKNLRIAEKNLKNILSVLNYNTDKNSRFKRAKALRGEGKFKEAIVEFQEALRRNRSDPEINEALGDMYKALQKKKLAVHYYREAVLKKQGDPGLHLKYAKMLQDLGNNDLAVKEFNLALNMGNDTQKNEILKTLENIWIQKIKQNARDASAHMNLGVVLQKEHNLNGALREYKIAESINPNDVTTRLNLGTLYQAKKQYRVAIKAYNTILQVKPNYNLAHYYKGTVLRDTGRLKGAIQEFQTVLRQNPNYKAKEALFETVKLFKNPNDIINILSTFARNNPHDPVAQFKYAFYLHSINRFDEAMEYYQRTLKADPAYTDAYLNIASLYKQKNQIPLAIAILKKGLKVMPNNKKINNMITLIKSEAATVRYQYALKLHTEGKYQEAIKEYQNIIQISEPDSDLYVNLGAAYQALKDNDKAIEAYKKAIEINDGNSTAYYYMGTAYFKEKDYEKALTSYQKALAINPDDKNIKQAIDSSKQVMTNKILEKGINEYNDGKYEQALLTFNTALITAPKDADIYYQRGMVYDTLKKYPLAISDYKHAIMYNPALDIAYYSMAVDYDSLKNYSEAKKWYEKFINESDNQDDEYVKYSKQRLTQL